jgi:hypothetical protein
LPRALTTPDAKSVVTAIGDDAATTALATATPR